MTPIEGALSKKDPPSMLDMLNLGLARASISLAIGMTLLASSPAAGQAGTIQIVGNSGVSAQMMFLGA